jgi:G:T-mismatch repair DNA endonuclease (very short patch repair protein)
MFKKGHVPWWVSQGKPNPSTTPQYHARMKGRPSPNKGRRGWPSPKKGKKNPMMLGNTFGRKLKGVPKSEEWKLKASLAKIRDKNPMRNPVCTRRMGDAKKGKPNPKVKEFWRLHKDDQIKKMMIGAATKRPNKLELKLIGIIERNRLPFRAVGNWQVILGGKCPDFLSVNGKKQLLELFGNYWHTVKARESVQERVDHFRQFGFDTLVIWQNELRSEAQVAERIRSFGGE